MAEWSKAAVLKTAVGESPPGVRIPPHPFRFPEHQAQRRGDRGHVSAASRPGRGQRRMACAVRAPRRDRNARGGSPRVRTDPPAPPGPLGQQAGRLCILAPCRSVGGAVRRLVNKVAVLAASGRRPGVPSGGIGVFARLRKYRIFKEYSACPAGPEQAGSRLATSVLPPRPGVSMEFVSQTISGCTPMGSDERHGRQGATGGLSARAGPRRHGLSEVCGGIAQLLWSAWARLHGLASSPCHASRQHPIRPRSSKKIRGRACQDLAIRAGPSRLTASSGVLHSPGQKLVGPGRVRRRRMLTGVLPFLLMAKARCRAARPEGPARSFGLSECR